MNKDGIGLVCVMVQAIGSDIYMNYNVQDYGVFCDNAVRLVLF